MRWLLYRNPKCLLRVCVYVYATVLRALPVRVGELVRAREYRAGYFSSLNAAKAWFFSPRPPLNEGETEGYVKLTAEEIAVKRSQHFFFLQECFSSPVLPVVVAFSRHPDPQKTFY